MKNVDVASPSELSKTPASAAANRLPLRGWALDLARRWNSGTCSLFILHGDIFDFFPIQDNNELTYVALKTYLCKRIFPDRSFLLFYDIGDGLTFGSAAMQKRFFEWLAIFDQVENTQFHISGPPKEFIKLAPLLRRFFLSTATDASQGITLIIDFPEKIIPATSDAYSAWDERMALVTLLKWASSTEMRQSDLGILLVTETAAKLQGDLLQNPHVAQIKIELPDAEDRLRFLKSETVALLVDHKPAEQWCGLSMEELAIRLSGLNLLRIQHLLAEAVKNGLSVDSNHVSSAKKRLIEDYCQGLVRFKSPKPGLNLDVVATHAAAKKKLREIAWLIKNGKRDVIERGLLLPGRVGVGKSFLVECFASECGLPVMELGEFRSKWVGDTEIQQTRILMTIRALGPVIVVVDEADAVFGSRESGGDDSGISSRVFAAFAAHIGDASLRGQELWIAMTSRPDLLAIDMKRQGRFGMSLPLFPAQNSDEVVELFMTVARRYQMSITDAMQGFIKEHLGSHPLTGSDVDAILVRTRERAVLAQRDNDVQLCDIEEAAASFIDPLDPNLLALQETAAVLSCSDKRFLPERFQSMERGVLTDEFNQLKFKLAVQRG